MKILSFDPGKVNFAYSCINSKTMQIEGVGSLKHPIQEFTLDSYIKFEREIKWILDLYSPDKIILERFMSRGRFNGASGEYISFMIGVITCLFRKTEPISASLWKSHMRRLYLLDKEEQKSLIKKGNKKYVFEMEHIIISETLSEHEIDAIGIGLFAIERIKNHSKMKKLNVKKLKDSEKIKLLHKLKDDLIRNKS